MATAGDVVRGALAYIQYAAAEEPVSSADMIEGVTQLNDMMASWANEGIRLGYRPSSVAGDNITAPGTAILAMKQNLAIQLAPLFRPTDAPVNPLLVQQAKDSKRTLKNQTIRINDAPRPDTLPVGSGNSRYNDNTTRYYPDSEGAYAYFSFSGNSTPQSVSAGVPAALSITWTVGDNDGFTASTSGTAAYKANGIVECHIKAQVLVRGSGSGYPATITLYAARNNEYMENSGVTKAIADTTSASEQLIELEYGPIGVSKADALQLFIESSADELLAVSGYMEITQCA